MITIEHLEVLFDAEAARDEEVFARLFARSIACYDDARRRDDDADRRIERDRSLQARSSW